MEINPYILLGIGCFFALLYAAVIIFGWARTRHNRRILQDQRGMTMVPTMILDSNVKNAPSEVRCVSLTANTFLDTSGNPIDIDAFSPYVAIGESDQYPGVKSGNLLLKDKDGGIRYVFEIPDLSDYR